MQSGTELTVYRIFRRQKNRVAIIKTEKHCEFLENHQFYHPSRSVLLLLIYLREVLSSLVRLLMYIITILCINLRAQHFKESRSPTEAYLPYQASWICNVYAPFHLEYLTFSLNTFSFIPFIKRYPIKKYRVKSPKKVIDISFSAQVLSSNLHQVHRYMLLFFFPF